MEGLQKAYNTAISGAQESAAKLSTYAASIEKTKSNDSSYSSSGIGSVSAYSSDESRLMLTRPQRYGNPTLIASVGLGQQQPPPDLEDR